MAQFPPKSKNHIFALFWGLFALNRENENFPRYGICAECQPTIRRFILGHFQKKLMTQFCATVQKPYFCPFQAIFTLNRENENFPRYGICAESQPANHMTLHFRSFLAKTNDSILRKCTKTLFLDLFGPFQALFPHYLRK